MIYLDMDGVLADFDTAAAAEGAVLNWNEMDIPREKMTPEQRQRDDKIREVMCTPGFFEHLPMMPDAQELWDFCAPWSPVILTARPRNEEHARRCTREKRAWVHRVFGPVPDHRFVCTLSSLKKDFVGHAKGPVQILVDDRPSNCAAWVAAGGKAVLHTSAADSIDQIKEIIDDAARWANRLFAATMGGYDERV